MLYAFAFIFLGHPANDDLCAGAVQDVCKWQSFDASCGSSDDPDSVIMIDRAFFGRMRLGSCLTEDYGHVGCVADVRQLIERRCAGRFSCSVSLPDVELDRSPHGCPPDLLAYLEVEFHCQTGNLPALFYAIIIFIVCRPK